MENEQIELTTLEKMAKAYELVYKSFTAISAIFGKENRHLGPHGWFDEYTKSDRFLLLSDKQQDEAYRLRERLIGVVSDFEQFDFDVIIDTNGNLDNDCNYKALVLQVLHYLDFEDTSVQNDAHIKHSACERIRVTNEIIQEETSRIKEMCQLLQP